MRSHVLQAGPSEAAFTAWAIIKRVLPLLLGIFMSVNTVAAQEVDRGSDDDAHTVRMLLRKIEELEDAQKQLQNRVTQLENAQRGLARDFPVQSPAPGAAGETQQTLAPDATVPYSSHFGIASEALAGPQVEEASPERVDVGQTLLNIRGFGDFSFRGQNQKGTSTSFGLGQIDLFITSNLSDRFRFVTDLVFEKSTGNDFEEDLERVLLEYRYNDYFKLEFGRNHTAIGYYNLAFGHSSWWQTAMGRPYLFLFEDEGGILPSHNVGLSASGDIPSGQLGLHYIAEIGNGRAATQTEPVQNFTDLNNHKSLDFNIFSRPEAVPGLEVGFSDYRDVLSPLHSARVGETILDTYVVVARAKFEWLNEGLLIRHAPEGQSHVFNTPGFYTQISEGFGSFRPYFRYQYVNAPDNEPIFLPAYGVPVGLQYGPSLGVRYDFTESVATKLQYDYTDLRRVQGISQPAISQLGLQLTFAF